MLLAVGNKLSSLVYFCVIYYRFCMLSYAGSEFSYASELEITHLQTDGEMLTNYIEYTADRMNKALRETQTLRAGCSKAEPKNSPRPKPPSRGCGTAKI